MTKQSKIATPPQPELKYVRSPEYKSTYANNIAYVVSALDFSLIFGQVLDGNKDRLLIEQNARVTMTPIQAKMLTALLAQQVAAYEATYGEITLPAGVTMDPRQISLGGE